MENFRGEITPLQENCSYIILSVLLRVLIVITPQIDLMPHLDFQNNTAGYEIVELSQPAA